MLTPEKAQALPPMTTGEVDAIDAWWRANNYLTVGQIYLQANPLLREPLRAGAHQAAAARPLGHQPRPVVHLRPRLPADPAHRAAVHLPRRARARRAGAGGRRLPGGHLQRDLSRRSRRDEAGMRRLFRQFSSPGRHPEPRVGDHAGLDPRGRRARLRPGARVRRGDGQPGPAGARRGRRRRGRDRPARGLLEGHLVPQPGPRRRGAADPAPQRREDRRPDGARPQGPAPRCGRLLEGHGYEVLEVEGDDLPGMHHRFAAALAQASGQIRAIQRAARGGRLGRQPAALAADRAAQPRRAGPARTRSTASRSPAPGARTRCRCPACGTTPSTWRSWSSGCGPTGRRSCSTPTGAPAELVRRRQPGGRPADERHARTPTAAC